MHFLVNCKRIKFERWLRDFKIFSFCNQHSTLKYLFAVIYHAVVTSAVPPCKLSSHLSILNTNDGELRCIPRVSARPTLPPCIPDIMEMTLIISTPLHYFPGSFVTRRGQEERGSYNGLIWAQIAAVLWLLTFIALTKSKNNRNSRGLCLNFSKIVLQLFWFLLRNVIIMDQFCFLLIIDGTLMFEFKINFVENSYPSFFILIIFD